MPLNFTPKGTPNAPQGQTTQTPTTRTQIKYGTPSPSTSRAEALKGKLTGKTPAQPAPPRRAGSSARAVEYAELKNQAPAQRPAQTQGRTTARQEFDQTDIPPQPSGLAPGAVPPETLSQPDTNTGASAPVAATTEPLSPQFAALAKQERMIRRAQQALKADRDAFQQEKTEHVRKADLASYSLEQLAEAGITPDRLVELQIAQANPDPNQVLLDKIAALEAKLEGVSGEFTKRDKSSYNAAKAQIRNDVQLLVDSDPTYETIKTSNEMGLKDSNTDAVVDLIEKIFHAEGHVLPVEEAARLVEEKATEREFKRQERFRQLSKIKARLEKQAEPAEASPLQQQPQTKTLTNNGAVQRPLSARERAILAVERNMAGKG